MRTFLFEWSGSATLTVEEIWPDGNAPENPTLEDVLAEVRKAGSVSKLCSDWNLVDLRLEVDGKDSGLR